MPVLILGVAVGVGAVAFGVLEHQRGEIAGASSTATAPTPPPLDPDRPPNIVLVTLCSVRADHVGAWGYAGASTPHLDALAADGIVFTRAWTSATYTLPSHATLFTGLLPRHAGVIDVEDTLAPTLPSLPEVLGLYGYRTLAYAPVASRASFRSGEGLERGFDVFLEGHAPGSDLAFVDAIGASQPFFAVAHFKDAHPPYGIGGIGVEPDPRVLEWGARSRTAGSDDADEWFLAQLQADPALGAHVAGLYDQAVSKADAAVGTLLDALERRGLLEHTVVVVAGDHGQALGEEGHIGHQGLLQPEVLHVPLLVRLPGRAGAGRRVDQDVGLVDLAPTLLTLAGADLPARLDGRSLVPILEGGDLPARGVLAQADVQGDPPVGGPQEVLVRGDAWLRYVLNTGVWGLRTARDGRWVDAPDDADPTALLAERAALSGPVVATSERPLTDDERAALRREGYW